MEENATAETLSIPHLFLQPTSLNAVSLAQAISTNIVAQGTGSRFTRLDPRLPAAVFLFQLDLEAQLLPEFPPHLRHHQPPVQLATFTMAAKPKELEFALSAPLHLHLI